MAIIEDINRPMIEAAKDDEKGFAWGLAFSLALHGALALVLLGGISGYVTEPGQEPVEVEIITVPVPPEEDAAAEDQAEEQPQSEEEQEGDLPPEPAPQEQETEEADAEEPPPEPAPIEEEQETAEDQPPPFIEEAVQEFTEEDSEPQESDLQPLQEPIDEEVAAEENATESDQTEPLDEAQEIAEAGTEESDVAEEVTEDPVEEEAASELSEEVVTEDAAPEAEAPEDEVPVEEEVAEAEETTAETPVEAEVAEDFDPLAGPVTETDTEVTPEPLPKPVELAEAGTEAAADVGEADEIAPDDFGTVGPIVSAAAPAPKPARPVARATRSEPAASSSAGTVRRPGHIQARQIYSANNPRLTSRMRGLTEGERLSLLCMTELDAQLTAVSPVPPEALPRARARGGTVLEYQRVAFRSLGRWFDIAFRCETNAGVTRVERFSFKIGEEIPRSQWLARGLTGF